MTTYGWTPGINADWNASVDWEPFGVPDAATADTIISASGNYTVTIAAAESFLVDSLTFNPGSGGTLDVNGTSTLGGTLATLTESSGVVNVAGTLSAGTLCRAHAISHLPGPAAAPLLRRIRSRRFLARQDKRAASSPAGRV